MKPNVYLLLFLILTATACSSLNSSAVYSDDIYFNEKKSKAPNSAVSSYPTTATYTQSNSNTQSNYTVPKENSDNRDYSQIQNYYSEEMNDSIEAANSSNYSQIESEQSYAARIARFNGSSTSEPYYSDIYETYPEETTSNVTVYVNDGYYNPWYDNYYYGAPYVGAYWGSGYGWGIGFGFGFPYYGYGYPYYGYGYPGYGCGYYPPYCGVYPPVYYPVSSEHSYGPRANGGSSYAKTNGNSNSQNGSYQSRAPRSASSTNNLAPAQNTVKSGTTPDQYARPARTSSYSNYSRSAQNQAKSTSVTNSTNSVRTSNGSTLRRNYSPTYTQPTSNARPQYNTNGTVRPTTTTPQVVNKSTEGTYNRPTKPVNATSNNSSTVRPTQNNSTSGTRSSTPSYNRSSAPSGGSMSGGSGGGSGGGGSRAPRR